MPQIHRELSTEHKYACANCPSTFIRQEHLSRHVKIHTREKPFKCSICNKTFSRQDVRNRHLLSHEPDESKSLDTGSTRACQQCAARRVRCSRGFPCNQCMARRLRCDYPTTGSKGKRKASMPSQHDGIITTANSLAVHSMDPEPSLGREKISESGYDFNHNLLPDSTSYMTREGVQSKSHEQTRINNNSASLEQLDCADNCTDSSIPYNIPGSEQTEFAFGMANSLNARALNLLSINWISPDFQAFDWVEEPTEGYNEFRSQSFSFPIDIGQQIPRSLSQTPESVYPPSSNYVSEPPYSPDNTGLDSGLLGTDGAYITSDRTHNRFYVDGDGARAPFGGMISKAPLIDIPTGNTEIDVGSTSGIISSMDYDVLLHGLQNEFEDCIINTFPPREDISTWAQLYFEKFHPMFPFLRRTSVLGPGSDWVLLLAVVTVGACLSRTSEAGLSQQLLLSSLQHVIKIRLVPWVADDVMNPWTLPTTGNSTNPVNITILQAAVLNTICMLHSGSNLKASQAMDDRLRIVDTCHRLSFLSNGTFCFTTGAVRNPQIIRQDWERHQAMIRTGLMIWVVDFLISCEFNCRPLMQLADATAPLPCSEYLWENPSVDLELLRREKSVTLLQGMEMLYMEKQLPQGLSEFGRTLLVYGICRRTKEVLFRSQTQLTSWLPSAKVDKRASPVISEERWPPSTSTLSRWRNSACDCLDILHWSANSKAAASAGWEHPTILHLHLSRLLLLTPLAHIQTLATSWTSEGEKSNLNNASCMKARDHVLSWALLDQFKARLSVVHAGALFWHARRYSNDMFLEPYAIYVATLVLWAYSIGSRNLKSDSELRQACALSSSSIEGTRVSQNIQSPPTQQAAGPDLPLVYLDRPIDDELVQTYIRLGHRMTGYISNIGNITDKEAPHKIIKEGVRLLCHDLVEESETQTPILEGFGKRDQPRAWGIEWSFTKALQSVILRE